MYFDDADKKYYRADWFMGPIHLVSRILELSLNLSLKKKNRKQRLNRGMIAYYAYNIDAIVDDIQHKFWNICNNGSAIKFI